MKVKYIQMPAPVAALILINQGRWSGISPTLERELCGSLRSISVVPEMYLAGLALVGSLFAI